MTERADDAQLATLRAFTFLCSARSDWRGALVLACGLDAGGSALSVAANIAGAGCLAIDERPEVSRAAMRSGACDFVVNTVDEALRVLKNEIRQRKPVSVGLTLAPDTGLNELLDRGVLPDLFAAFGPEAASRDWAARRFAALGSAIVEFDPTLQVAPGVLDAVAQLEDFARQRSLRLELLTFATAEELRAMDARLLEIVPAADLRHRWCAAAPRFFHRERPYRRAVYLTTEELDRVASGV